MKTMLYLLFILSSPLSAVAGGTVENGGDSVRCVSRANPIGVPENKYFYFVYDYVEGLGQNAPAHSYTEIASWPESERRVLGILSSVSARLSRSFSQFAASVDQIDGVPRGMHSRRWIKRPARLAGVTHGLKVIPTECAAPDWNSGNSLVMWVRTISRIKKSGGRILYYYDPEIMRYHTQEARLQFSLLMVHEWLWDHSQKAEENRAINRFLHSREIESMPVGEIQKRLRRLGLRF